MRGKLSKVYFYFIKNDVLLYLFSKPEIADLYLKGFNATIVSGQNMRIYYFISQARDNGFYRYI
jgi:hypothetical protein